MNQMTNRVDQLAPLQPLAAPPRMHIPMDATMRVVLGALRPLTPVVVHANMPPPTIVISGSVAEYTTHLDENLRHVMRDQGGSPYKVTVTSANPPHESFSFVVTPMEDLE